LSKAHKFELAGITFLPDHSGALYAPDLKTLLVADLHLEHGASLARRGIHIPPLDTGATLTLLERVIAQANPWRLVLLGDSFHDSIAHEQLPEPHRTQLQAITAKTETIWISGNHDPHPPQGLGGICLAEHKLGSITLRHEPSRKLKSPEIAGHLHPGATIVQRGIATRGKCFVVDPSRIIMPAFGIYTGALNIRSPAFANLFDEEQTNIWLIGKQSMHKFPMRRV
jgi:uncharacterized protein